MKRIVLLTLACILSVSISYGQKAKKSAASTTWTGYVVDKMCKTDIPYTKGKGHTKECLLAEDCISTGFGLATADGKWIAFDKKGSDMAGNYIKYGASEGKFGNMNASKLPVDSHELIAMCAPRPVFISYGIPEKGDAKWLDHQGSYMAAVAAGPVFKLLGVKDLGVSNDYLIEQMPGVNVDVLNGTLAWRQHDGGHTDAPNMKYFIQWADKLIHHSPPAP